MTTNSPSQNKPAANKPHRIPVTTRLVSGIAGLFLAAMLGGFSSRLGSLGMDEIRGAFGFGYDESTWISSFYSAGELLVMPFVTWLVQSFSFKRVHAAALTSAMLLAAVMPFASDPAAMAALRFFQGIACGILIFMFMMSLFFMLPAEMRMYGFGGYAMVAAFAPSFGVVLTALFTDVLNSWEFLFWHSMLLGLPAMLLVQWGIPPLPSNPARLRNINWFGMACAVSGCILVALSLSQGVRLEWFESGFVALALPLGLALIAAYAVSDWNHPNPFLQIQVFVSHRNVWMALLVLLCILTASLGISLLPVSFLGAAWGFKPLQMTSAYIAASLPQFIAWPLSAYFLYRRWLDARVVYSAGIGLLLAGCLASSSLDGQWQTANFICAMLCFSIGLPTSVVSTIFMVSSNIDIKLGPSVGGAINTLRCIGILLGGAVVGQFMQNRQALYFEELRNKTDVFAAEMSAASDLKREALIGAVSDAYLLLAAVAAAAGLLVWLMKYTPAPHQPPRDWKEKNLEKLKQINHEDKNA